MTVDLWADNGRVQTTGNSSQVATNTRGVHCEPYYFNRPGCPRPFRHCRRARLAHGRGPLAEVAEWISQFESPKAVYESGVTGFHLVRELRALGIDCIVGAAPKMERVGGGPSPHEGDRDRDRARPATRPNNLYLRKRVFFVPCVILSAVFFVFSRYFP